ncbi:MAG: SMC-Scp complex subunit ScpB [Alicyclobacillaceae bacterium]|nr:SMC-Scp complex subunit ScpB [Alicyclobacillaceae bacterium]
MAAALEAVLFAAGHEGMKTRELAELFQVPEEQVRSWCEQLQRVYEERAGGLAIVEIAGAWQIVTRPEFAPYLTRMAQRPAAATLSHAALEVLAVIAYRQPVSRADIEAVRGVQSDRAIQTLIQRHLVREVGREDTPGRPILYGTTDTFLQVFGLRSLADLPPVPEEADLPRHVPLFSHPAVSPRD